VADFVSPPSVPRIVRAGTCLIRGSKSGQSGAMAAFTGPRSTTDVLA
jgi:hypothetical protein